MVAAESALSIEFQMSLLLFASLLGYLLASRINQSAVIGEILIGLLLGPSFFGLITYTDFVQSVGHLGAIILLFVVGLESKIEDIFNIKYFFIAFIGVLIPWIIGYAVTLLLGYDKTIAIFTATTLTATSIAISAKVLQEMNKLDTVAAKAIIGAAVADDVLALVVVTLTLQYELIGRVNIASGIFLLLKAGIFIALATAFGYYFLSERIRKFDKSSFAKRYPEFVFIAALTIAFLYSMIAEYIGLSGILGAFVAGVSLESVRLLHSKDYREGAEYLHIIFGSIFFVSLGVIADVHAMQLKSLIFLVAIVISGAIGKIIGCSLPARAFGMSNKDSLAIGIGMIPRGEVGMIAALLGLANNIIGQEIYTSLVLMSLITTMITPVMLRKVI